MAKATKPQGDHGGGYAVGYGRPPKAHQFKPGQSGNPRGRPKGQPCLQEVFLREASRLIGIKTADGVVHVTKREAIVRKLLNLALEGDPVAIRMTLSLLATADPQRSSEEEGSRDDPDGASLPDEETIRRMLGRVTHLTGRSG